MDMGGHQQRRLDQHVGAVALGPLDAWMTCLHPRQQAIVTRNYAGPARISGPAGTGKTVVALHRLRYLARNSDGPLLFTTFVQNLPQVRQTSFRRFAPEVADRVQFTHLQAWARGFLADRGRVVNVDRAQVNIAFNRAWSANKVLGRLAPQPQYWQDEIDRVIKGRGITTLDEYLRVTRPGRTRRLSPAQKAQVWRFYRAYQRNLAERRLYDNNDVVALALKELGTRPLERPYAAVVVDEVQDITLTGLRLLRQLAGDGPNRLLLVGDGQQQVYPGGWRLSEAGIPIKGRGEVLRINYRNRANILAFAQRFDAKNEVDDLDDDPGGAPAVTLRDVECANPGGEVHRWRGPVADLPNALVDAVRALPVPLAQTALITSGRRDVNRCATILRQAGIPVSRLGEFTGQPGDAVKENTVKDETLRIGTVHNVKGQDFRAVLAVVFPHDKNANSPVERENRELRARQHLVSATRPRDYLWWAEVEQPRREA